ATTTSGAGINVTVHFTKKLGAPVRFVSGDDTKEAGAIRELDLQRKYHLSATKLAKNLGLTRPRSTALRWHLEIENDKHCAREFVFGKIRFRQFPDNAVRKMKSAIENEDMVEVWMDYKRRKSSSHEHGRSDSKQVLSQILPPT
ncbi:MAG: hypothetical protein ACREET_02230, partial [Stellaceae bacterium]